MEFFRIKKTIKIIFINLIILLFLLYILELFLQLGKGNLFKKTKFYYQNKIEKESKEDIVLSFAPYKFIGKNKKIIPLSGISNKKTILCLDKKNKPVVYKSDKFGFNNENEQNLRFLIIGDSYVHGQCVENKFNLVNQINSSGNRAAGLGIYANVPLLEYATFIEYAPYYSYDTLIWVFTPDNDFFDVSLEIKEPILKKYYESGVTQDLFQNNTIREKIIYAYLNKRKKRKAREFARLYHLDLAIIRGFIKSLDDEKTSFKKRFHYHFSSKSVNFIQDLLIKSKIFQKNNKNLIIVINAINPDIMFPDNKETRDLKILLLKDIKKLKEFFYLNQIKYVDFNKKIENEYNKKNINEVFNRIRSKWDHYTPKGYAILNQEILDSIN